MDPKKIGKRPSNPVEPSKKGDSAQPSEALKATSEKAQTVFEYYQVCLQEALRYLAKGEIENAINSFLSDMSKNPETEKALGVMNQRILTFNTFDQAGLKEFLEGIRV